MNDHLQTVAVFGLGAMGLPIAARLAERFDVIAFDPDPVRQAEAAREGIRLARTATDAVAGADAAVLAVRSLDHVVECLFGDAGIVAGLPSGSPVTIMATIGREGMRDVAARAAGSGVAIVDAPVSGGPARARAGDLLITVGADASATESARPILDQLASRCVVVGDAAGDGQAMKIVNQLLCGVHIAAAAEALSLAEALGLDPAASVDVLMAGAAGSFMLGDRGPRIARSIAGDPPPVFSRVDIFVKDMGLVMREAEALGVRADVAAAAERLYLDAVGQGLAASDDASLAELTRRSAVVAP